MFPAPYFPPSYFPPSYFPNGESDGPGPVPPPKPAPDTSRRNLLRWGFAWQTTQLEAHASEAITYVRGHDWVECRATLGNKPQKVDDGAGNILLIWTELDFLIPSARLVIGGETIEPEPGDLIFLTVGGQTQTFEVTPYDGRKTSWTWSEPHQSMRRVHTKFLETEAYS